MSARWLACYSFGLVCFVIGAGSFGVCSGGFRLRGFVSYGCVLMLVCLYESGLYSPVDFAAHDKSNAADDDNDGSEPKE